MRLLTPKPAKGRTTGSAIRRHLRLGGAMCVLLIFGVGGWSATAQLAGAIIAPGSVVVETDVKKIQHQIGGVVAELSVKNGDFVEAGKVLLRLDNTTTGASLTMVTKTLDELAGRRARLLAEQAGEETIDFPAALLDQAAGDNGFTRIIAGERRLFDARKAGRSGQEAQLRERIAQLEEEAQGLTAQKSAKDQEIVYIKDELSGVEALYARNLIPVTRVTAMRRDYTRLEGERGQLISAVAQAKGKIVETELKIIQVSQDLRTEVLRDLREIEGKIGELMERRIAAEDQFKRTELRAPQSGIVHQLSVHTVGGVISPGETLMVIVPQSEGLSVEARLPPQAIDQVRLGQPVRVRFSAFDQNTTPQLVGNVSLVAADVTRDQRTNQPYFAIRIAIPDEEIARLHGLRLVPGMPAEVHLQTHMRTAITYLAKPLMDQFYRAFRED